MLIRKLARNDNALLLEFFPSLKLLFYGFRELFEGQKRTEQFANSIQSWTSELRLVLGLAADAQDRWSQAELSLAYLEFVESCFYVEADYIKLRSSAVEEATYRGILDTAPWLLTLHELAGSLEKQYRTVYLQRLLQCHSEFSKLLLAVSKQNQIATDLEQRLEQKRNSLNDKLHQLGIQETVSPLD